MKRINQYLTRQLVVSTLMVGFVMTGVIWLFVSVRAVDSIVNRGLSIKLFMYLTVLQVPNFLVHIIPFSIFIATLFVYSRLNSDRELVVLRAAGMSPISLARPALLVALVSMLFGYALTLYGTPKSYQIFRNLQWDIRYSFSHILLKEGVFNVISDHITVFVRERSGESELRGLLIHDSRNKNKPATVIAEKGVMVKTSSGARVVMFDGNRQIIDKKTNKLSILYFDRYSFDLSSVTPKPEERFREARERMVDELLDLKIEDVGNPRDFGKFKVEGHQRLTTPINTLGFALIALVCLLLGDFSRRGQVKRILLASVIFVSLQITNLGLINISAKNLQLVPLLYASIIAPVFILLFLLLLHPRFKKRAGKIPPPDYAQVGGS
ncbi:MAG: LPS export ABC transporter permease LptF [Rhodospirillales bacterium]|jgi:lipopolysaccharide export system permease protein